MQWIINLCRAAGTCKTLVCSDSWVLVHSKVIDTVQRTLLNIHVKGSFAVMPHDSYCLSLSTSLSRLTVPTAPLCLCHPDPLFQLLVIVFALLTWCFWFSSSLSSHCYCASFFFLFPCNYHISSIRHCGYFFSAACFLQLLFEGGYYSRVGFISLENQRRLDKARMSSAVTIIRCCQ